VNIAANLKDAAGTSLASFAESPPLSGDFNTRAGPIILSIVADDPDGADAVFGNGDAITVTFSEATNEPTVNTKATLDGIFAFSQSLGTDYAGLFIDPETLIITIVDSSTNGLPSPGTFTISTDGTSVLKSGTGLETYTYRERHTHSEK